MFRKMARAKQQIPEEECIELLKNEKRGVLSVLGDDDYPYGMPINHFYNDEDGKIYFHGGKSGHKVDAVLRHDKASFCVYDQGYKKDGDWALNIRSVIVFGRIEMIDDVEKIYELSRRLSYKFTDDEGYIEHEIQNSGPGTLMFALVPEHMTGKLVREA
ncbi:MAG: pyridoxamine 5'-phosphate oxidase family protein [Eubacterium sp.]|nr:pyridoxamine 5'-phosphate oxidase family protein [Eubacterium sp.]